MSAPGSYPFAAFDAVVAHAKAQDDGCVALSSEFRDGAPTTVLLIATASNPERVALLHALHHAWYPDA